MVPELQKGIAQWIIQSVSKVCLFPMPDLQEHFPAQFVVIDPLAVNNAFHQLDCLNRCGQKIAWTPTLHPLFRASLGRVVDKFVVTVLLCFKHTDLAKISKELQIIILGMCLEKKLLIAPVKSMFWNEPDYYTALRSLPKVSFMHYRGHFPKVFHLKKLDL